MKNTEVGKKETMLFQYYITEDGKIYKNDDVIQDKFGHTYTIVKFINHKSRKNKKENYLVARLQSLEYKTKAFSIPVELLENYMKVGIKNDCK